MHPAITFSNTLQEVSELTHKANQLQQEGQLERAEAQCQTLLTSSKKRDERIAAWFTLSLIAVERKRFKKAQYLLDRMKDEMRLKELESGSSAYTKQITVQPGDTLSELALQTKTTQTLLKMMNPTLEKGLFAGAKVRVLKQPLGVEVDISDRTLQLKSGKNLIRIYSVAVGNASTSPTPRGEFLIANKVTDPTWYKKGEVIASKDPNNRLGSRWMGLDVKGYGIHGTTDPASIGEPVSSGCIRMLNRDVEELYDLVPLKTPVKIRD